MLFLELNYVCPTTCTRGNGVILLASPAALLLTFCDHCQPVGGHETKLKGGGQMLFLELKLCVLPHAHNMHNTHNTHSTICTC